MYRGHMANILIIDDEINLCEMLKKLIEQKNHYAEYCFTIQEGVHKAISGVFEVVFLDIHMPDGNGIDVLKRIKKSKVSPEVVIITGSRDPDCAEDAIRCGAWDYLHKPFSAMDCLLTLTRALQYRDGIKKIHKPAILLKKEGIIGSSPAMKECLDKLAQASNCNANVLITGETGTGKEIFARALHLNSARSENDFVVVDCAALPETLVESYLFGYEKGAFTGAYKSKDGLIKHADQGTLFLDEAGELDLSVQKSFLRVLQERKFRRIGGKSEIEVDFRLVAATNKKIEQLIEKGLFRQDLLYRLRAISIDLPPLRERLSDMKELVLYLTDRMYSKYDIKPKGFSPDFIDVLCLYTWPGNVRELINTLESAISKAQNEPILFPKHLPEHIRIKLVRANANDSHLIESNEINKRSIFEKISLSKNPPTFKEYRDSVLNKIERKYFKDLIAHTKGNIQEASRISSLSRSRLYDLLKKYNISRFGWHLN